MTGRARDGRLVHVPSAGQARRCRCRPGDTVTAAVTYAAPHHLVADAGIDGAPAVARHRRDRAPGAAASC